MLKNTAKRLLLTLLIWQFSTLSALVLDRLKTRLSHLITFFSYLMPVKFSKHNIDKWIPSFCHLVTVISPSGTLLLLHLLSHNMSCTVHLKKKKITYFALIFSIFSKFVVLSLNSNKIKVKFRGRQK